MNKTYGRINWENYPSDETPLNESNLNKIDVATDEIDNRVITLDTTKATKEEVSTLVQDVTFEEKTGIITIVKKNGSKITIDTQMEKIAVNFSYNAGTQQIILTLIDGTKQYIDLAALITQYEFLDSDTVAFSIDSAGKVSAIVKEASIKEKHLQPNYLADIKVETAKAAASQKAAATSESNAKTSETAAATSESNAAASATKAQSYATGGTNSRTGEDTDNAKYYSQQSAQSQSAAATSADTANTKAEEAEASAATAKTNADNAAGSANIANEKANSAANSATIAVSNSNAAQQYASNAAASADTAQNYAVADTDSAKYYYEQARRISESFSGALRPMGTVAFANLPALSATTSGNMYNISDQFVTTSDFKEGAGNTIPAGANVYKTEDGKWDVLAGTPVTGVKGSAESAYRRGNVNITAENVGAIPVDGNAGSATTVQDYNDTSKKIKVGWVGSALNEDQILAVACYSGGDDDTVKAKIKDVTKDTFINWLGTVPAANNAAHLGRNGNAGYPMTFNWAGKGGQPTWLWGGENGSDMYVYNPSNFSVNYAASAGNAAKVNDHTVDSDVPSNAKFTDTNTWRGIQDNLTSASTVESLSANQGRKLANGSARDSTKIPLTGSTEITGNLIPKTHAEKTLGDSAHYWKEAYINNVYGKVNGHAVNADVPSNAVFTDTKGSVASNNGVSSGYAMLTLASGYKILAFHTAARNYAMTNTYGNMYWASFEIPIPVTGIKYFTSVNVTPFATSGLISVSITNYTVSKIQGFVFSPLAETKNISFHVTVHGTAS
nr:MAG TPA: L SHAPED TAIL FIBER PROTEIN [Caudoviricetes sp.]